MTFSYLMSVSQCNHHKTRPKVVPVLYLIFPRLVQEQLLLKYVLFTQPSELSSCEIIVMEFPI